MLELTPDIEKNNLEYIGTLLEEDYLMFEPFISGEIKLKDKVNKIFPQYQSLEMRLAILQNQIPTPNTLPEEVEELFYILNGLNLLKKTERYEQKEIFKTYFMYNQILKNKKIELGSNEVEFDLSLYELLESYSILRGEIDLNELDIYLDSETSKLECEKELLKESIIDTSFEIENGNFNNFLDLNSSFSRGVQIISQSTPLWYVSVFEKAKRFDYFIEEMWSKGRLE